MEPATDLIEFTVNGERRQVESRGTTTLLQALRGPLGLTGTRFGCGLGMCGACMVLLDGQAVTSCDTPLWSVAGRAVRTVEGLADGPDPHPVQRAFLREQAAQCGYCTSGMLISATALLAGNPAPDEEAVVRALDRNLCRCGSQPRAVRAILEAAAGEPT